MVYSDMMHSELDIACMVTVCGSVGTLAVARGGDAVDSC